MQQYVLVACVVLQFMELRWVKPPRLRVPKESSSTTIEEHVFEDGMLQFEVTLTIYRESSNHIVQSMVFLRRKKRKMRRGASIRMWGCIDHNGDSGGAAKTGTGKSNFLSNTQSSP